MRRNIMSVLLVLVLTISLASCGKQQQPQSNINNVDLTSFQKVQSNMKNLKDAAFKINFTSDVSGEGVSTSGPVMYMATGQQAMNQNGQVNLKMHTTGIVGPQNYYRKNGTYYMNDPTGTQIKLESPDGYAVEVIDVQNLLNISKDMFSDLKLSKKGNNIVYSFVLKQNSEVVAYVKKSAFTVNTDIEGGTIKSEVPKFKVTIVVGTNNMVKSMDLNGVLAVTYNGNPNPMNYSYKLSMDYTSINTGLKINFPDFSQYVYSPKITTTFNV